MAEDIVFNVEANVSGGAKSLSDLKKEFKELQGELSKTKEGTKEYQLALQKLGAVKDDIGDLRDTISALNPEGKVAAFAKVGSTIASGFAAAQGAAALFGAESEELQKTMLKVQAAMALAEGIKGIAGAADAMKVLNAVMKFNPIFLIAGAIIAVGAALFALKDKVAIIGKAFEIVGDIIGWLMDKVTEFTDAIGLSNSALDKQGKVLTASINSATEALNKQTQAFDDQIAIAKASGKSTIDLEIAKQKAIIETNKALVEQTIAYVRQGGELDKERAKLLTQQLESIKAATVQIEIIEAQSNAKKLENHKKYLEEKDAADKLAKEKYYEHLREMNAFNKEIRDENKREETTHKTELTELDNSAFISIMNNRANDKAHHQTTLSERIAAENAHREELLNNANLTEEERVKIIQESEAKIKAEKQKTFDTSVQGTKQALQMTQQLTDMFFDYQLKKNKGNAAAELEIRKKQFKVNKAFGVVNAVVDGVGAVQKALNNPYPLNLILAVLSGVLAAANVAKIASSKFEGGDSGGGASDVQPGSMSTGAAPAIPQPNNTVTQINDNGTVENAKPKDQKVFIVETDITDSNKRVANIEETAKI